MMNKVFFSIVGAFMAISAIGFSDVIYADNERKNDDRRISSIEIKQDMRGRIQWSYDPAVVGTVTAVQGETITLKSNTSTYSIDASNAKIMQGDDKTTLASIAVGDTLFVQGAINGSSVVATSIIEAKNGKAINPNIKGDLSGVVGAVTKVSGTTITIEGKNDVTYTINAANAKIWKNKNQSGVLADIQVGDTIIVQGKVSGTNVVASNIVDTKLPVKNDSMTTISGEVTAVSGNTLIVKGFNGTTYSVLVTEATFKDNKNKDRDISDIKVGETVTVKGAIDGTTITASTVIDGKVRGNGFFHKFGSFFKNLFGRK